MKKPTVVVPNPTEEWVTAALTDDEMVVELLLRIKHAGTVESENNPAANLPLLRWGFRQRRSRPSRLGIGVGVGGFMKKETDSARASPMTPLCWSGGSGSGGSSAATVDGFEDTSRQSSCSTSTGSGSKALRATNEITSFRSKRNKAFLELKDAENLQLKERFDLHKKIANVIATYEEQSVKNQGLKRIKLEYSDRVRTSLISSSSSKSNLVDESSRKRRSSMSQKHKRSNQVKDVSESYRPRSESKSYEEKSFFFVPDLNMTPTEEDETLYGTS